MGFRGLSMAEWGEFERRFRDIRADDRTRFVSAVNRLALDHSYGPGLVRAMLADAQIRSLFPFARLADAGVVSGRERLGE